jgi:hypothetical protein
MSRWSGFEYDKEDIPTTPYEAAVFLMRASAHIKQGNGPYGAWMHISDAHAEINRTFVSDTLKVKK